MLRLITLFAYCYVALQAASLSLAAERPNLRRPNILLAIADDASYPHMGAYGTEWTETPAFDRIAREGLLFTRCYTPNANCAPSRACLLTGRNSWQLEAAANHWCEFPSKFPSFIEVLAQQGYATGFTGKGWAPGVALDDKGQRRNMTGRNFSRRQLQPPTTAISGIDYSANFNDFLDSVEPDQPFCFWYGGFEPHRSYEYASGANKAGKHIESIKQVPEYWPDNEIVRNDMLDYALEIEHFDRHLGQMLALLEQRGQLENTLIVVTSDNGMPFPRVKGNCYELSNHLPLAMMWPAGIRSPGRTLNELISFIDFAPTFFDLVGLDWGSSGMQPTSGLSLAQLLQDDQLLAPRQFVLIGKERHDVGRPRDGGYPMRGIVSDELLLIQNYETDRWPAGNPETGYLNTDGSPTKTDILQQRRQGTDNQNWQACFGKRGSIELYNVVNDPSCRNNLAGLNDYASRQTELLATLVDELTAQGDPRMAGQGTVFDNYPYADPSGVGFYEKFMRDPNSVRAGWVNPTDFEPLSSIPQD